MARVPKVVRESISLARCIHNCPNFSTSFSRPTSLHSEENVCVCVCACLRVCVYVCLRACVCMFYIYISDTVETVGITGANKQ